MTPKTEIDAPIAEKIPHTMTLHGETRVDDYYWMRDDERKDPKIIAHLNAENAKVKHTAKKLHQAPNLTTLKRINTSRANKTGTKPWAK